MDLDLLEDTEKAIRIIESIGTIDLDKECEHEINFTEKVFRMENIDLNKLAEETADKYEKRGSEFWRGFHAGFIYGFNKCNEDIDTEKQRILSILNKYRIDGVNFQNEKTPLIHSKNFNDIILEILNVKNMEPIIYDFEKDIKTIEHILPRHYNYKCELRENGVHCYSETGIPDDEECFWRFFIILLKQSFGERFIEVFHQTCTNHKKFTVYLKKSDGKLLKNMKLTDIVQLKTHKNSAYSLLA